MFKKSVFKNGLRAIYVPQKTSQAVTVLVLVGTGSRYEKKEINGISHFLEHMMFKGTKKMPTPFEVAETLDKVGAECNAFTSEDFTGYYAKAETSKFGIIFDWVSDIFLNSSLPRKEIEKERGVIVEEINMYYDHPMRYSERLWTKLLYGNQPAGRDIAGTKDNVKKMPRKELVDYRKKQYVPGNTVLCLAGNINIEKAEKKIKEHFVGVRGDKMIERPKVIERQSSPQCLLEFRKTDQTHLWLGVRGYNIFHPMRYAQQVLGMILGGGGMMSSRIFSEIREKMGLVYYIATEVEASPDTGFLATRAGVVNDKVEEAVSAILKEYKKIAKKKVSAEELKKAKNKIKGRMALSLEPSDAKASFFGLQELLEGRILTAKETFKEIDKVSQNDILKVAEDIFRPGKLNLALIGPFKDKKRFEKILKI